MVTEEELMANLEDTYLPVSIITPTKQTTEPLSSGSARSMGSSATTTSDRQRLEGMLKANSTGVMTQATHTSRGEETASTSEVSYSCN